MIILSAFDVAHVIGFSPKIADAALRPIPLINNTYMLNERVLDDPAHADVADYLADLPREADVSALVYSNLPGSVPDPAEIGVRGSEQAEAYWTSVDEADIKLPIWRQVFGV